MGSVRATCDRADGDGDAPVVEEKREDRDVPLKPEEAELATTANRTAKRTQFTVSWPIQGISTFRSEESELVLSDVYWRWIFEALSGQRDDGRRLPFVEAVEDGFDGASDLEIIPVTPKFLELLREVAPSSAPSFSLLVPTEGCPVSTPEQILAEFTRVVGEALSSGVMEMEME